MTFLSFQKLDTTITFYTEFILFVGGFLKIKDVMDGLFGRILYCAIGDEKGK